MASLAAPARLLPLTSAPSLPRRRNHTTRIPSNSIIQSNLQPLATSSQNPKSSKSPPPNLFNSFVSVPKSLALTAASGVLFHLAFLHSGGNSNFNSGDGGGGGGGGGGNGGQGGGFWSRIFSSAAIAKDDEPQQEWDNHGLPANIVVQLNKLSGFKKYKVSDILFLDRPPWVLCRY
ncbi:protein TOC75-3 [Abeliophyllum distichum]|uniref:Protein TOC75-3 n=1 Tax=Abeliophyllum distichum TaxID=126358 RepID=A0ABD1RDD9_9LAMI